VGEGLKRPLSHPAFCRAGGADDAEGGSAGSDTGGGGSGADDGEAGAGGAAEGGAAEGGAPQAGAGGAGESCTGCARLLVPMDAMEQQADFEIDLSEASLADLSATIITWRVRVVSGLSGGMQLYAKNGETQSYASQYSSWRNLNADSDWQELTLDLSAVAAVSGADGAGGAGGAGGRCCNRRLR